MVGGWATTWSSDQHASLLKDTTLKEFMRLPLSAVQRVLVNAGRLLAATWRQQPGIVIAETAPVSARAPAFRSRSPVSSPC